MATTKLVNELGKSVEITKLIKNHYMVTYFSRTREGWKLEDGDIAFSLTEVERICHKFNDGKCICQIWKDGLHIYE